MLRPYDSMRNRSAMRGFTLIEMMVAIVVGMIVVGGAVSLVVAINQANSETIQSTRLTQELRTLAAVISDDVKRTRRIDDPIGQIGLGSSTVGTYDLFDTYSVATSALTLGGNCLAYGYQGVPDTAGGVATTGSPTPRATPNFNTISLQTASGVGAIWLVSQLATQPTSANCSTTSAVQLSSSQVSITGLTFTCIGGTGTDSCTGATEIDLTLTGQFVSGDTYTKSITRSFTQPIFIRSIPA